MGLVRERGPNSVRQATSLASRLERASRGRVYSLHVFRFMEWFKSPLAKYFPDEDVTITQQEERNTIAALKSILAPFTLRREAKKTFHGKKQEFIIWLPLSPWQEVLCDTVREKEVERWAGTFGINPMNGLCQRVSFDASPSA